MRVPAGEGGYDPIMSNEKTEAVQAVVDRVSSYQDGAPEGTVEKELRSGLEEAGVTLDDGDIAKLAQAIESEGGQRLRRRGAFLSPTSRRFPFAFAPSYRLPALLFGITPATAWVDVDDSELRARFGPWSLRTPRSNVAGLEESGDFAFLKTAGPPHLSFTDRGVTLATNGDRAVCVRFHERIKAIDPTGRILHPGATFTVADPAALIGALESS